MSLLRKLCRALDSFKRHICHVHEIVWCENWIHIKWNMRRKKTSELCCRTHITELGTLRCIIMTQVAEK